MKKVEKKSVFKIIEKEIYFEDDKLFTILEVTTNKNNEYNILYNADLNCVRLCNERNFVTKELPVFFKNCVARGSLDFVIPNEYISQAIEFFEDLVHAFKEREEETRRRLKREWNI